MKQRIIMALVTAVLGYLAKRKQASNARRDDLWAEATDKVQG